MIEVKGKCVDKETRCEHYHTDKDVIAIKFKCCHTYYPCYSCHEETSNHTAVQWSKNERHEYAVLCGVCQKELTIQQYMDSEFCCPHCQTQFNPNCARHYHLYF